MSQQSTAPSGGRADARRNREQILDAAAQLLARDQAITINDIALAAGLGRATVYRHFADVTAVQTALLEEAREAGKGIVRERLDPARGWCEGSLAEQLLTMTRENLPRTSRWTETLQGEAIQDEELVATFSSIVAATFRQGQQRGEFRNDVDVDLIATTFVALTLRASRLVHGRGMDVDLAMQPVTIFLDGLRRGSSRI